jgi:hypothetical protein
MQLPGNVDRYNEVPLPAFDYLEPRYILPDSNRRLKAWSKAMEAERRLDHFEWLSHVARMPGGIQTFVLDFATAYLLSLESALQILKHERFQKGTSPSFDTWIETLPANDLVFRGLRTMRHLEAHIRQGGLTQRTVGGHSRFISGEGGTTIGWQWAEVSLAEFRALDRPKIREAELPAWNNQLDEYLIMDLMRLGIERLRDVFATAEK